MVEWNDLRWNEMYVQHTCWGRWWSEGQIRTVGIQGTLHWHGPTTSFSHLSKNKFQNVKKKNYVIEKGSMNSAFTTLANLRWLTLSNLITYLIRYNYIMNYVMTLIQPYPNLIQPYYKLWTVELQLYKKWNMLCRITTSKEVAKFNLYH